MKQGSQEKGPSLQNIPTACPWKTYLPQENLQTVEFGGEERTRVDKLTQSKHNRVSIFNSIVTSVYIVSDINLGTLVLFFSVDLKDWR